MNSPISLYCVVGIRGSGRRTVVRNLLDALPQDDRPAALITSADECAGFSNEFPTLPVSGWQVDHFEPKPLVFDIPAETKTLFICSDGIDSPIHLLEALALWCKEHNYPDLVIVSVVHCTMCATHHQVHSWYQAAIHFSDFVLLNQREGVDNKWLTEFQKPFQRQFYPCIFESLRNDRLRNPAVILTSPPRRMSQAFEDTSDDIPSDDSDDDESFTQDPDDVPPPELHFERLLNKHYRRPVPKLDDIL